MHRSNGPGDIGVEVGVGEGRGELDNTSLYRFPAATLHGCLQRVSYILISTIHIFLLHLHRPQHIETR